MRISPDIGKYRVVVKSADDSVWVRQVVFEGSYQELLAKFGTKKQNALKPFVVRGKKYTYFFTLCLDYWWHSVDDPRPNS
jgi:hypothetical protein